MFIKISDAEGRVDYLNPQFIVNVILLPVEPGYPDAGRPLAHVFFSQPWAEGSDQKYFPVERPDELAQLLAQLDLLTVRPPAPEWIGFGDEWLTRLDHLDSLAIVSGEHGRVEVSTCVVGVKHEHLDDGENVVGATRAAIEALRARGLVATGLVA